MHKANKKKLSRVLSFAGKIFRACPTQKIVFHGYTLSGLIFARINFRVDKFSRELIFANGPSFAKISPREKSTHACIREN